MFRIVEVADPLRTKQLRAGPDAARRGRRDPGVPPGRGHRCCCSARSASCSSRSSRTGSSTSTASRRASCRAAIQVARWVTCDAGRWRRARAAALHRRQRASRRLRRGRCADGAGRVRARAARDREQLAEDPLPRAARARRAGVPEAARGLSAARVSARSLVSRAVRLVVAVVVVLVVALADGRGRCSSPDARARSARAPSRRGRSRPAGRRRCTGRSSASSSAGAPAGRRGRSAGARRRRGGGVMITGSGRYSAGAGTSPMLMRP